jgi:hypothetical protein
MFTSETTIPLLWWFLTHNSLDLSRSTLFCKFYSLFQPIQIWWPTSNYLFIEDCSAGGVAQVVECLPSKHKALSANPSTAKKKMRKLSIPCLANGVAQVVEHLIHDHEALSSSHSTAKKKKKKRKIVHL